MSAGLSISRLILEHEASKQQLPIYAPKNDKPSKEHAPINDQSDQSTTAHPVKINLKEK
jgi:hypothetical protein